MTHDLFQLNPALGAFTSPINPAGGINPVAAQQMQLAALATQAAQAAQLLGNQNPLHAALHHQQLLAPVGLQNPFVAQQPLMQQNPFVQQNPLLNAILAQQLGGLLGPQIGPQPYMQYAPINPAMAPQSWVGPAGQYGGGQINPLVQQLLARQFQTPGFGPWGGI